MALLNDDFFFSKNLNLMWFNYRILVKAQAQNIKNNTHYTIANYTLPAVCYICEWFLYTSISYRIKTAFYPDIRYKTKSIIHDFQYKMYNVSIYVSFCDCTHSQLPHWESKHIGLTNAIVFEWNFSCTCWLFCTYFRGTNVPLYRSRPL